MVDKTACVVEALAASTDDTVCNLLMKMSKGNKDGWELRLSRLEEVWIKKSGKSLEESAWSSG